MSTVIEKIISAKGRGLAKSDKDADEIKQYQRLFEQELVDSEHARDIDVEIEREQKNSTGYASRILQPEASTGVGQNTGDTAATGHFVRVMNQNNGSGVPMTDKLLRRKRSASLRGSNF